MYTVLGKETLEGVVAVETASGGLLLDGGRDGVGLLRNGGADEAEGTLGLKEASSG